MMGIADRLDALTLHVTSPDGNIAARLRARREVRVAFRPGSYNRYDTADLERQLAQVGKLLWTRYRRGYDAVVHEAGMRVVAEPQDADDPTAKALLAKREEMIIEASSPRELIRLRTKAMLRWKVSIEPGVTGALSESEFTAELHSAINTLFTRWSEAVRRVHEEVYDPARARRRARTATDRWTRNPRS